MRLPWLHMETKTIIKIVLSFLVAFIFTIAPLPNWLHWFYPQWIVLVLIYWILVLPEFFGIFAAWLVGIFLDLLYNTVLGEHAIGLVVICYFLLKFHARINFFSLWQKTAVILLLLLSYQSIIIIFEYGMGKPVVIWMYLLSTLISAIFWPYLAIL